MWVWAKIHSPKEKVRGHSITLKTKYHFPPADEASVCCMLISQWPGWQLAGRAVLCSPTAWHGMPEHRNVLTQVINQRWVLHVAFTPWLSQIMSKIKDIGMSCTANKPRVHIHTISHDIASSPAYSQWPLIKTFSSDWSSLRDGDPFLSWGSLEYCLSMIISSRTEDLSLAYYPVNTYTTRTYERKTRWWNLLETWDTGLWYSSESLCQKEYVVRLSNSFQRGKWEKSDWL